MRIVVDGSCWGNRRGFGRFTRCLVDEMVRADKVNEYLLVVAQAAPDTEPPTPFPAGVEVVTAEKGSTAREPAAASSRRLRDMLHMTSVTRRLAGDVVFFPATYSYFPVLGCPVVVTVHDAIAERLPQLTLPSRPDRVRWWLKQTAALRQARAVITVSEASRRAIREHLRVPADRLHVIREAPAPHFRPTTPAEARQRLARFGPATAGRYLLYVGGISPHKNLEVLIESFSETAIAHPDVHLVIVGDTTDDPFLSAVSSVRSAVSSSPVAEKITLTGFVTDDELVALYSGAVATALPSLGEGFGLTAAESAACGTPVVSSRDPALVELLGEAGVYADAASPHEFAERFRELLADPTRLAVAADAVAALASTWSWADAARITIEVLERAGTGDG